MKHITSMKVLGINGSPRRQWNTATLVEKALEGAASAGAKTELVHLYQQTFNGCVSCFACKRHISVCRILKDGDVSFQRRG